MQQRIPLFAQIGDNMRISLLPRVQGLGRAGPQKVLNPLQVGLGPSAGWIKVALLWDKLLWTWPTSSNAFSLFSFNPKEFSFITGVGNL